VPSEFEGESIAGAAEKILAEAVADVAGPEQESPPVVTRIAEGPPAQVLLNAATGAELLVVGSRGHGTFAGMLLGSVSQHCVQHAPCPVVVIPDEAGSAAGTPPL